MSHNGNEADLVEEATRIIGGLDGSPQSAVLAAGVFSLDNLLLAQTAGVAVGAGTASIAGASPVAEAASAVLGGRVAVEAAAAAQGASVRLLVAVTDSAVHVLNSTRADLAPEIARFDRSTVEVTVRKRGLSRIVELSDPATGAGVSLHGSVSPISAQSKPDKLVLHLLS